MVTGHRPRPTSNGIDVFGIFAFLYIIGVSLWALKSGQRLPLWVLVIVLFIGILGFAVDSAVIYSYYLK